MATPDEIYDFAKKLLEQAEAILNEPDPTRREKLPLDEPPKSVSWPGEWNPATKLMLNTFCLYLDALDVQRGDHTVDNDLKRQIEKVRQLLGG